ncbi:MAG: hypothetical protein ACR2PX_10265 [Endozoicomonas sp.]|uniref:hypothetical protein n=1 Tax=Endozoicomonas sp. TaxID=1892382 RepID=UPI003D9B29D6
MAIVLIIKAIAVGSWIINQRLSQMCSRHFSYRTLICCGETFARENIDNLPLQEESWEAISKLARHVLDPVVGQFGDIELTYAFCSRKLSLAIAKNSPPRIAPKLDQHAGYELNSKGERVCERGGQACDFLVPDIPSTDVARWLVQHCPFDRLYYYGARLPIHVSYSDCPSREVCWLKGPRFGRRQPYRYTVEGFLEQLSRYEP